MMWNLEGMRVTGTYLDLFHVAGKVETSRVKYGGGVCHHIVLDNPITVFQAIRDRVILDHKDITQVQDCNGSRY